MFLSITCSLISQCNDRHAWPAWLTLLDLAWLRSSLNISVMLTLSWVRWSILCKNVCVVSIKFKAELKDYIRLIWRHSTIKCFGSIPFLSCKPPHLEHFIFLYIFSAAYQSSLNSRGALTGQLRSRRWGGGELVITHRPVFSLTFPRYQL